MDTKLQSFISEIQTMSDVRSVDTRNPIAFDMQFPSMSMLFRVVGSIVEPSSIGYPINVIWVVLDGNSPYYRQALQLKSATANDSSIDGRITDVNFQGTWVVVDTYDDLYLHPQYYVNSGGGGAVGPQGPKGDPGYIIKGIHNPTTVYGRNEVVYHPATGSSYVSLVDNNQSTPSEGSGWALVAKKGDDGEGAEVDVEAIIQEVIRRLSPEITSIRITDAPTSIFESKTFPYKVIATFNNGTEQDVTSSASAVLTGGSLNLPVSGGSVSVPAISANINAVLTATYTPQGKGMLTATHNITLRNKEVQSVAIGGATTVNEGATINLTATATYNDGTTQNIKDVATWAANAGTITANGNFTAPQVSVDSSVDVTLSYTEEGVTRTATRTITVKNVVVANKARYLARSAVTNMADYNSAFVNALTNQVTADGLTNTFNVSLGANQFGYYAHPKAWGVARFEDLDAPGFFGGWDGARNDIFDPSKFGPYEVQATVNGVTEAWLIYRTDMSNLGNTRWSVTPTP